MVEERKFLGEYLVEKKLITKRQLTEAIEEGKRTGRRVGDIIVRRGWAKEEDIARLLSEQLGFAFIDVTTYQFDPSSVILIPVDVARRLNVIAVYKIAKTLTVAMADPLNVGVIDELERITGYNVNPVFGTSSGINTAINKYYEEESKLSESQIEKESPEAEEPEKAVSGDEQELPKLIEEATQAPVIKLVNKLISDAVKVKASDVHLEPQEGGFFCRYRVDGILQDFISLPQDLHLATVSRVKIMANIDITERRLPQDGRIQLNINGREIDLRVATFPTIYGEHVAIRILDRSLGILALEEIGIDGNNLKKIKSVIRKPHGMILVTGPTGSGKTTTLYSVLNTIRDTKKNIITLEDPVEYSIPEIHQSQVNARAGLTFAVGLRSIVRLDPDIIMIGEIRDKETAEIAIHAALTGHLVFSTLHTNDAPGACARLIDIGVEPYLIASSVTAVLAQRLVRKLCPKCRKSYQPTDEDLASIGLSRDSAGGNVTFYREEGCKACNNTGYSGRTGIFELFVPDDHIRGLITRKAASHELAEELKKGGMKTLLEDGLSKLKDGMTSLSEVLRVTEEA